MICSSTYLKKYSQHCPALFILIGYSLLCAVIQLIILDVLFQLESYWLFKSGWEIVAEPKKCCFQTNLVGAIDLCSVTVINAFRIHSGAVGGCCYFRLAPLVYVCSCACPLLEGLFTSVSSYYKHCVAAGTIQSLQVKNFISG